MGLETHFADVSILKGSHFEGTSSSSECAWKGAYGIEYEHGDPIQYFIWWDPSDPTASVNPSHLHMGFCKRCMEELAVVFEEPGDSKLIPITRKEFDEAVVQHVMEQ